MNWGRAGIRLALVLGAAAGAGLVIGPLLQLGDQLLFGADPKAGFKGYWFTGALLGLFVVAPLLGRTSAGLRKRVTPAAARGTASPEVPASPAADAEVRADANVVALCQSCGTANDLSTVDLERPRCSQCGSERVHVTATPSNLRAFSCRTCGDVFMLHPDAERRCPTCGSADMDPA